MKPRRNEEAETHIRLSSHRKKKIDTDFNRTQQENMTMGSLGKKVKSQLGLKRKVTRPRKMTL
jgi:hypothetical protein